MEPGIGHAVGTTMIGSDTALTHPVMPMCSPILQYSANSSLLPVKQWATAGTLNLCSRRIAVKRSAASRQCRNSGFCSSLASLTYAASHGSLRCLARCWDVTLLLLSTPGNHTTGMLSEAPRQYNIAHLSRRTCSANHCSCTPGGLKFLHQCLPDWYRSQTQEVCPKSITNLVSRVQM